MSQSETDNFDPVNNAELEAVECEILGDGNSGAAGSGYDDSRTQEKAEFIGGEKCGKICGALSELIASRKGDKYKLSEDEQAQIGSALDPVLLKYLPSDAGDISAELSLALVAFAIIVPRMGGDGEK
ncbi:MAG: hypothetical protein R8K20_01355 [Gallionellaceae bacterium]